ncbi:MAG: hypothetical protein CMJ81_13115 [Planctomycetaceae bacterium]|nr:hypothetical protein [Planctomycetaceae bacterium]MBP60600.1 hypothetical protein [Planctomycetaceae bacterium]
MNTESERLCPLNGNTVNWRRGWGPILILPSLTFVLFPPTWPPWGLMWALAVSLYAGCKWLTWRRTPVPQTPLWKHVGYLLFWPGLDAESFLKPCSRDQRRAFPSGDWVWASTKLLLGLAILFMGARQVPAEFSYLAGWVGMIGIVTTLHFGVFHLIACAWRSAGVDAQPLMNRPLASVSVSEFWGRRWNTAFRDLTNRFLFRPLIARWGASGSLVAGFAFSGLIHDLVISVPSRNGYGGPTLFFILQSLAILATRSRIGRRVGLRKGIRGWMFTAFTLLLPVGWLFHRSFIHEIVLPFMGVLRALE